MRVVCSYCRQVIREASADSGHVSHGICPACDRHFERMWGGISLAEYLDELEEPVAVVDADARVCTANLRMAELTGRARGELRGLLAGEAVACVHSRLPEGCGGTVHCRECAIRRTVGEVARTGRAVEGVESYLDAKGARFGMTVGVRPGEVGFVVTLRELTPLMSTRVWHPAPGTAEVSVEGAVDLAAVGPLCAVATELDVAWKVRLDFQRVRQLSDLAVARLATELGEATGRFSLVGLPEHHQRVLRYIGVDPADLSRAAS